MFGGWSRCAFFGGGGFIHKLSVQCRVYFQEPRPPPFFFPALRSILGTWYVDREFIFFFWIYDS